MRERIVAVLSVVVPHAGRSDPSVRHRLNEQENIGLIYSTSPECKGLQHAVDHTLITAEHVTGERLWPRLDLCE